MHLSACLAQPCCGGGSCAFPACRGGRAGERRGGVAGEASAGPGCGGSVVRGSPDGTLEETPHRSCMSGLLWTIWCIMTLSPSAFIFIPAGASRFDVLLIYLGTAEHWSECSVGRLWFWAGASPDPPTSLTCLNQTHTFHKSVQCLRSCKSPWSRMLSVAYLFFFFFTTKTHSDGMVDDICPKWR